MLQCQSPFFLRQLNNVNKSKTKSKSRINNQILKNEYIVGEINGNRTFSPIIVKKHIIEGPVNEEMFLQTEERFLRVSSKRKKIMPKVRITKEDLPVINIQKSPVISNSNIYKDIVVAEKVNFL
jgi:hypothetical protein